MNEVGLQPEQEEDDAAVNDGTSKVSNDFYEPIENPRYPKRILTNKQQIWIR
jgi:hypothetical protein